MKIQFIKENMISYTEPINDYDTYHLKCTAYTTNVNGVFKIEWYYPPHCNCFECKHSGGASVFIGFDGYEIEYITPKNKKYYTCFVTEEEAIQWYIKTKKKKGYKVKVPLYRQPMSCVMRQSEIEKEITKYIQERGINKYYDIKIVDIDDN